MKSAYPSAVPRIGSSPAESAFTIPETMLSVAMMTLIVGGFAAYLSFTSKSIQGVTQQSVFNEKAGNTMAFIESRVRQANSITNDAAGETLTLSFDDNPNVDSDNDGKKYNDTNHFERFQRRTNDSTVANNRIYYKTNTSSSAEFVLASSVRKIPGQMIFTLTNSVSVIVNFGLYDSFSGDNYQALEMQGQVTMRSPR
jgi:hypothetical protein